MFKKKKRLSKIIKKMKKKIKKKLDMEICNVPMY